MEHEEASDEFLAARAKEGDRRSLEDLARRFLRPVYAICRKILQDPTDAEDACQEVFVRLVREVSKYEEGRRFSPWIFKMSTNVAYNFQRSETRRAGHTAEFQPNPVPESSTIPFDELKRLSEVIQSLPPRYGLALIYKFQQGLSQEQIAELLDVPVDSVRVVIFRALAMVREKIKTYGEDVMSAHLDEERATYYVYGLATSGERHEIERHASGCSGCRMKLEQMEGKRPKILAAIAHAPLPEGMEARLLARLRKEQVAAHPRRRWFIAGSIAAAATVLVAILVHRVVPSENRLHSGKMLVRQGERWVEKGEGYILRPEDRLCVEKASEATIMMDDRSMVTFSEGAVLEFHGRRGKRPILTLFEGRTYGRVTPGQNPFSIETPVGRVTVLGTEFTLDVWYEGGTSMRKHLRVVGPAVAGVAVIVGSVAFRNSLGEVRVKAGESAIARKNEAPTLISPKEYSRLQKEVEKLRSEVAAEKFRAEKAETSLAEVQRHPPSSSSKPSEGSVPSEKAMDWKKRSDSEFEAKVKAVPWKKTVGCLIRYFKELQDAQQAGRGPQMDPEMIGGLTILNSKTMELAEILGIPPSEFFKVYSNGLVGRYFMDAMMEALAGQPLSEEQLGRLRQTAIYSDDDADYWKKSQPASWKHHIEGNLRMLVETKGILTSEQHQHLSKTLSPTFMVDGYVEKIIQAGSPDEATGSIVQYWSESFKLSTANEMLLSTIARDYVRDYSGLVQSYGGQPLSREQEAELLIKRLDLQIASEQRIAEMLPLSEEDKKRVLMGSGTALRLEFSK